MRRHFVYHITAAGLVLLLAACASSPLGHRQLQLFSQSELAQMGAESYRQIKQETPISHNAAINNYVACVARALTRQVGGDWEITVFKSEQINAFALPGGKIGVYTGLLDVAQGQNQLAAVIGHEIGHVLADHSNARLSAQFATSAGLQIIAALAGGAGTVSQQAAMSALGLGAQVGLLLPYSRGQESEADLIGLQIMARAGFDPRAAIDLWQNMSRAGGAAPPELLSTHPSNQARMQSLRNHMGEAMRLYRQAQNHPHCG